MKELIIKSLSKSGGVLKCVGEEAGAPFVLKIAVEEEYSEYLCDDRVDGFFIICLYKAIKEGYNIKSLVPVSERVYYQAKNYLNKVYAETFKKSPVEIDVPLTSASLPCHNAIGTGISMGVDSLYTIATHSDFNKNCPDSFKVSHLVLMNAGAFISSKEDGDLSFKKTAEKAGHFSEQYGYKFVKIDTNILAFIPYWQMEWHGIVNGSIILSLQKLFSIYYSSSSYKFSEFRFNPSDLSQAELFNLMVLSTDTTRFYSTGGDVLRIEKVRTLTKWEPSYDYLQVCAFYSHNCSEPTCQKCGRTMVEIDVFNALDKYAKSFDIERYKANPWKYLYYLYGRKTIMNDHYVKEMWDLILEKYPMSFLRKILALAYYIKDRYNYFGGISGMFKRYSKI